MSKMKKVIPNGYSLEKGYYHGHFRFMMRKNHSIIAVSKEKIKVIELAIKHNEVGYLSEQEAYYQSFEKGK